MEFSGTEWAAECFYGFRGEPARISTYFNIRTHVPREPGRPNFGRRTEYVTSEQAPGDINNIHRTPGEGKDDLNSGRFYIWRVSSDGLIRSGRREKRERLANNKRPDWSASLVWRVHVRAFE